MKIIQDTSHQSSRSVTRQERFAVGSQPVKPEDKQKETEGHKRNTFECIAVQGDEDTYYAASKQNKLPKLDKSSFEGKMLDNIATIKQENEPRTSAVVKISVNDKGVGEVVVI